MHIYKQILLYILNENTIWPSGAIARDIVSQEKNTMWIEWRPILHEMIINLVIHLAKHLRTQSVVIGIFTFWLVRISNSNKCLLKRLTDHRYKSVVAQISRNFASPGPSTYSIVYDSNWMYTICSTLLNNDFSHSNETKWDFKFEK